MSASYRMLSEFTDDPSPESISVSPYWVVAVIRYAQSVTFSRAKLFSGDRSVGFDSSPNDLIREKSMLVLSDDVLGMNISHSKSSYLSNLNVTLANGDLNYLAEIRNSDWVMAWIVNDVTKGTKLRERIMAGEAANEFDDGLKFIGRVQGVRKNLQQAADGSRVVHYSFTAVGFREFNSSLFFDPALSMEEPPLGEFLMKMGMGPVFDEASTRSMTTTKIIPELLQVMVGRGIPPEAKSPGGIDVVVGNTGTESAPYAFVVPSSLCSLLGQEIRSKTVWSYADVLELVLGVQRYTGGRGPSALLPDGAAAASSNHRILNDDLKGSFQPLPVAFAGKTCWSLMEEFKNPAINEMYACLRATPGANGKLKVMPTLVVRQLPFNSPIGCELGRAKGLTMTGMLELPRWYADPILINHLDVGISDAMRVNFVHIYGQASLDGGVPLTLQITTNPPVYDEKDSQRNGLSMHMQTVNCSVDDTHGVEARQWMEILGDIAIGQQNTLTGTCSLIGISAPICPGDNFEFDGVVYHIESVNHSCGINGGIKSFTTGLTLTHGIRSDEEPSVETAPVKTNTPGHADDFSPDYDMYAGVRAYDNLGHDPGQSVSGSSSQVRLGINVSDAAGTILNDQDIA